MPVAPDAGGRRTLTIAPALAVITRTVPLLVLDLYEHEQTISLVRHLDPAQPQVRGDAGRIRQLLHNLLKNAIEASGGTPQVEVSTTLREDGTAELAIGDRGGGLPAGFDDTWFEPYKSSKPRGTGLGLAVVRKIVEEHGATVRA